MVRNSSKWLNLEGAANYLGLGKSKLYSLAQQGRVPANKIGKLWRFAQGDLDAWARATRAIDDFFVSADARIEDNPLLRDPQREGYLAVRDFFERGGTQAIVQIPVGCGKSGLAAILPFGISRGRVLVVAPNLTIRRELKDNLNITNRRKCFWRKTDILPGGELSAGPYLAILDGPNANIHDCDDSHIVLTNIQQLASSADRWLPEFPDDYFDLIVVDEGHHSAAPSWMKVFERFPRAKVVNLTATPFRSDQKELPGDLVYRYSFKRAMAKGYIKSLRAVYVAPDEIYFTYEGDERHHTLEEILQLKEETWFSRGVALAPECNRSIVDASLDRLEELRRTGTHHQLIASAISIRHARAIRSLYAERGYSVAEIHTQMRPSERETILERLRAGLLDCVIQVQMLGEGFDHPHLSVAAVFRPYRSLSPYVQFIGRIMRVIVQNESRHPDNTGFVVSHLGMNVDSVWQDFKELEREDSEYFQLLMAGEEPLVPQDVLSGEARKRLSPDMVVKGEVVSGFLEEDFLSPDDVALVEELKRQAEALGFDADEIADRIKSKRGGRRLVPASPEFPVLPQLRRREAKRRLVEESKSTARVLLNLAGLSFGGKELSTQLFPGSVSGDNFPAAVQMVHHERNRITGVKAGELGKMTTEKLIEATERLEDVLKTLTRRIKKRMTDVEAR